MRWIYSWQANLAAGAGLGYALARSIDPLNLTLLLTVIAVVWGSWHLAGIIDRYSMMDKNLWRRK